MKIRMITTACGPTFNASAGEVVDVDSKFGKELIDGHYAEPAKGRVMVQTKQALANEAAVKKASAEADEEEALTESVS